MLDHSKVTKMHFWMIQSAKKQVFGRFLDLGPFNPLDIAYFDRTICFSTFGNTTRSWRIIPISQKSIFEWSEVPKRGFLDLGLLDRLDIAYYDRTKCCPTFGNTTRSRQIIRSSQKCIFEWSKTAKMVFWPLSSVLFGGSTWYCLEWLDDKFTLNSVHNLANMSLKFRINRSLQLAWTYTQLSALRCVLCNLCVLCVLSALSLSACSALSEGCVRVDWRWGGTLSCATVLNVSWG